MFFVFDGIDGAGKSTQIKQFSQWLESLGHDVICCADPGSTELGNQVRKIVLGKSQTPIHFRAEMLLFSVARAQLIEEVIRPAITAGKTVVCDRFFFSTLVYQGHAGNVDLKYIHAVTQAAIDGVSPDVTFLFDLPVDVSLKRLEDQGDLDRMESRGREYLQKVRDGFLAEAGKCPDTVEVIDATQSIEEIQNEIRSRAKNLIDGKSS